MRLYNINIYATTMVLANSEEDARARWENNEDFNLKADEEGGIFDITLDEEISEEEALLMRDHYRNQEQPIPWRPLNSR